METTIPENWCISFEDYTEDMIAGRSGYEGFFWRETSYLNENDHIIKILIDHITDENNWYKDCPFPYQITVGDEPRKYQTEFKQVLRKEFSHLTQSDSDKYYGIVFGFNLLEEAMDFVNTLKIWIENNWIKKE